MDVIGEVQRTGVGVGLKWWSTGKYQAAAPARTESGAVP